MAAGLAVKVALRGEFAKYEAGVAQIVTGVVRRWHNRIKAQGRRDIERAGLGRRLANALRGQLVTGDGRHITKRGTPSDDVRGRIYSKALIKTRPGGLVDLFGDVFEIGVIIRGTPYLAVPTPAAGGRRARSPKDYPEGTFKLVPVQRGRGRPKANAPVFLL